METFATMEAINRSRMTVACSGTRRNQREQMKCSHIENHDATLARRLYCVLKQSRQGDKKEFAHGWRIGANGGGTVIDSYESTKHNFMQSWIHSRSLANTRMIKINVSSCN